MSVGSATMNTGSFVVNVQRDQIDVTSWSATPNESWVYADRQGHEHHYDNGYPTLSYVIDEQHWCEGDEGSYPHDGHWQVDAAHYECKACGETIEPGMDPPGTPKFIAGATSATLEGVRSDGARVVVALLGDELDRLAKAQMDDAVALSIADAAPSDRIMLTEYGSQTLRP